MKRLAAGAITVALMIGLMWIGLRRPAAEATKESAPSVVDPRAGAEARVRELLECGRAGNVDRYLSSFTNSLRERLAREVDEKGRAAFAAELRNTALARKSHALYAPEPDGPGGALVTVESVFADRNERQTYHLTLGADGWRISDVETVRQHVPKVKFGDPATFQEPEGPPVPKSPLQVETP